MCYWCDRLPRGRNPGAVFLVLVKKYYGHNIKFTILTLRAVSSGKLTLPGGCVDAADGGCCIKTAKRETYEECGLNLDRFTILDCCYLGGTRTVLVFAQGPNDLKRSTIDRATLSVQHRHRRACYHETIAHCELIDVNSLRLIPEAADRVPMHEPVRSSLVNDTLDFIRMNYMHLFQ